MNQHALRSATVERAVGKLQSLGVTDTKFDPQVRVACPNPRLGQHALAAVDAHDASRRADPPGKCPHVARAAAHVQKLMAFANSEEIVGPLCRFLSGIEVSSISRQKCAAAEPGRLWCSGAV